MSKHRPKRRRPKHLPVKTRKIAQTLWDWPYAGPKPGRGIRALVRSERRRLARAALAEQLAYADAIAGLHAEVDALDADDDWEADYDWDDPIWDLLHLYPRPLRVPFLEMLK